MSRAPPGTAIQRMQAAGLGHFQRCQPLPQFILEHVLFPQNSHFSPSPVPKALLSLLSVCTLLIESLAASCRGCGVCVLRRKQALSSVDSTSPRTFSRTPHEALWHGWPLPLSMTLLRARCPVLWCEWTDHVGWPADLLLDVWAISACWVRRVALLGA